MGADVSLVVCRLFLRTGSLATAPAVSPPEGLQFAHVTLGSAESPRPHHDAFGSNAESRRIGFRATGGQFLYAPNKPNGATGRLDWMMWMSRGVDAARVLWQEICLCQVPTERNFTKLTILMHGLFIAPVAPEVGARDPQNRLGLWTTPAKWADSD
ncbi:unnamed protein product [Toxocara canis]|uniref:PARP catalytic domain-containing protein n=1 Tax=Toxocara canis TaxID=6265 RepID=A0A183TVX9_TOXCA|nr:unnamed protein product [Toxocara canis]